MLLAALPDLADATPLSLAIAATAAGALDGALRMLDDEESDIVGMTVIAFSLGFGGGIIRDILVGDLPPAALLSPWYVLTVLVAVLVVALLGRFVARFDGVLLAVDAATLGLFAIIGTQKALSYGLPVISAVFVGVAASVGGGVIADLLLRSRPMILRPGPPYALIAVVGASSYAVLIQTEVLSGAVVSLLVIALVFAGRLLTYKLGVKTRPPNPPRLGRR